MNDSLIRRQGGLKHIEQNNLELFHQHRYLLVPGEITDEFMQDDISNI